MESIYSANSKSISKLSKKAPHEGKVYHASRIKELKNTKLYSAFNPEIKEKKTTNGDQVFGNGIYATTENSGLDYAKERGGQLFIIDIRGKKFFDLRRLTYYFQEKNSGTILNVMSNSSNPNQVESAKQILDELKLLTTNFITFLEAKSQTINPNGVNHLELANTVKTLITLNRNLLKVLDSNNVSNLTIGINYGQTLTNITWLNKFGMYYFSEFLDSFGFDGVIGHEIADWKAMKGSYKGKDLVYVLFDKDFEGIEVKSYDKTS